MSRTQHLRWKRKAAAVAALTVGFTGYVAIGAATVSAGSDGAWDCSEIQVTSSSYEDCTYPDDTYPDDTYPDDTYPDDTVPVDSVPVETDPPATAAPTTVARAVVPGVPEEQPAVVAPEVVRAADVLPATGRTSTLASLFIAIGLVGAGSVAIAVARRSANSRSREA